MKISPGLSAMDTLTPEQRKKAMRAVKSADTRIERKFLAELRRMGLRYRKHVKTLPGKPDAAFMTLKIAVFCDGDFWHGRNWHERKHDHKSNQAFWHRKIESNMERDRRVNAALESAGWTVLRFWGSDIEKNAQACAQKVAQVVAAKRKKVRPAFRGPSVAAGDAWMNLMAREAFDELNDDFAEP
ncbi:MAG: very short patch repair endonuclease [Bacteroidia bacterium]|nr:very short patch repair endonuclease [Bacteroidia bacterium]MDW8333866.1 very short patch repair endonuclease [Bacteroidia bacterium]